MSHERCRAAPKRELFPLGGKARSAKGAPVRAGAPRIGRLVVVGVGLVGGSFALGLKAAGRVDAVVGIESRGFIVGTPVAYALGVGVALVRKAGKLPWETVAEKYALEYGEDALHAHRDACAPGHRVLVVDDNPTTRDVFGTMLEALRFDAPEAAAKARERCLENRPWA